MHRRNSFLFAVGIFAFAFLAHSPSFAELTDGRFRELLKELEPTGDEPWLSIPWKTALLDAQGDAASKNKPIFIWAMDGHPLGCT